MATVGAWLLESPPTTSSFSTGLVLPPIVGSAIDCDSEAFDQDYFLRVLDKAYPADYVFALKSKPSGGYELFQASAKVGERVSLAISRMLCCAYLMSARGGAPATGLVEFYRTLATAGAYTVKAGSTVTTTDGRAFATTEDAVFTGLDLGPHTVAVEAVAVGYEYNVPGQAVTAAGEVILGEISEILKPIILNGANEPQMDAELHVRQLLPTAGGRSACLDGLASDLLLFRNDLENDESFRVRILETPDTVSPAAIRRGVNRILEPYGATVCFREVGTDKFAGIYYDAGASTDAVQDPAHNFAYDMDPTLRPEDRWKVWLDHFEMRAFFLIGVPVFPFPEFGFLYDTTSGDTYPTTNAYDTIAAGQQWAAYDGFSQQNATLERSIWDMVDAKRAGGVQFDMYVESSGCV